MKSTPPGPFEVKAGELIISEGEPGKEMYIIEQGQVEIVKRVGSDQRRLGMLEAGDFFGEMAILDDQPRGASARAVKDTKLLRIDASTFDQMLRQYPEIAVRMLRKLSARLREASANPEVVRSETITTGPAAPAPLEAPAKPRPAAAAKSAGGGPGRLVSASSGAEIALPNKDDIKIGRFDQVTGIHPDIDLNALDTNKMTSRRHAKIL
ncbi:MAG TPA: cyclic nucleotide-binding domain-containing protein, partial [Thermoanaerobaculia bacterium]|nr:cyclic nucleotide-binding domain-containing protein [Thermoanaerobaculia bacterium]